MGDEHPPRTRADLEKEIVEKAMALRRLWADFPGELRDRIRSRWPAEFANAFEQLDGTVGVLLWMRNTGRDTNVV